MIWSISAFKSYQRCQRRWFYDEKVGSRSLKDAFRREVYLLSQLETIDAWRGKIVDYTISEYIIPKIQRKQKIDEGEVLAFAKKVTRARYDFAKAKRHKEEGLKKSEHDYDFAALMEFEFESDEQKVHERIKKAWEEIEIALKNFLSNSDLIAELYKVDYLVTQRALTYKLHDFTIKGVPDLIAFYSHKPPKIFDWKVHYWGTKTYNDQLLIYAISLTNCNPHVDFKNYFSAHTVEEVLLSEYQLLKNTVREYFITPDEVERINDVIADATHSMERNCCNAEYKVLDKENFSKTPNLDNCKTCPYKRLCQEN